MVALFFEAYGALCVLALIAFLIWAAVAKLRPDLEEEEFPAELEKLKKLVSSKDSGGALPIEPPIVEKTSWPLPARPVKQSERPIRRPSHLFDKRKSRTTRS